MARAEQNAARQRTVSALSPTHGRRYAEMEHRCRLIEGNYQSLTGTSQVYLAEQRRKLDVVLQGAVHRLLALQRYGSMPQERNEDDVKEEIEQLEKDLKAEDLNPRAASALQKNLDLKKRLLASLQDVEGTVQALNTELDSMESLLEVLHQNSISLRDPQAISHELDEIVRQSEHSERVVREMEALLGGAETWDADSVSSPPSRTSAGRAPAAPRSRIAGR